MRVLLQYRADGHRNGPDVDQMGTEVERGSGKVEKGSDNQEIREIHRFWKESFRE